VVERLLAWLRVEVGEDLLAVWLFGSRARAEADLDETDPDRRSDVDLMVVVAPATEPSRLKWELSPRLEEIADEEGESPVWFSVLIYDSKRLWERRRIRSFFFQEVDRDKRVLFGDGIEGEG
jgi:predicted nucleotidyltransferase